MITLETQRLSYEKIKENLGERQINVFSELVKFSEGVTANELAKVMFEKDYFPTQERNNVHPRLHELVRLGLVETLDKRKCSVTGRTCAVYVTK